MPPKKAILLYEVVIDYVKERIANGTYTPGQRLPSVSDLAAEVVNGNFNLDMPLGKGGGLPGLGGAKVGSDQVLRAAGGPGQERRRDGHEGLL